MKSIPNHQTHHIILIGFKSVGKSAIGKELSLRLHKSFIDLDHKIESLYEIETHKKLPCRQIMLQHGQDYFRNLENRALHDIISSKPMIISLGGGTPLNEENQKLIQGNLIIHITASRSITFERIMTKGRPAFFSPDENPLDTFNRLWDERKIVYEKLAILSVDNCGSIKQAVDQILLQNG
jgi:shikimate kinase